MFTTTEAARRQAALLAWQTEIWKREGGSAAIPDSETLRELLALREETRADQGGAASVDVAWSIAKYCDLPMVQGVLVGPGDEAIGLHAWNILPDGGILDVARDRFGLEHACIIASPGHPALLAYRPEWSEVSNPDRGHPAAWAGRQWSGTPDHITIASRRASGSGWWCTTPAEVRRLADFGAAMATLRSAALAPASALAVGPLPGF